jgi:hypothetical protein
MRYILVAALIAQLGPPGAQDEAREPPLGNGRTAPAPRSLVPFTFMVMLIWLRVASCFAEPVRTGYRTQIPF